MALYLADTSAWNRSNATDVVYRRWTEMVERGELALCPPVKLELLYSARGPADYDALDDELLGFPNLPLDEQAVAAALATQGALAAKSQHRGPTPMDLLIAAIAALHGAVLLHYDRHFDLIARMTEQSAEWLARPGSLR